VHIYAGFLRKAGYVTKMAVPSTHKRLQAFENTVMSRMDVKK
jgi:tartrate dehydratase beta subunit/fumarate hydratase class I family protein